MSESMAIRFYTLPPRKVEWPYLLVNPRNYKELFKRKFKHAILDSGVEMFKDPNLRDYPRSFLRSWKYKARNLTEIFGDKLWVTIPDYPDDLAHQFGHENVDKTLRNVEEFIAFDGVNWLIPIQSQYLNIFSFIESCQRTKELIGDYSQVAIGTVCKTNNLDFIEKCCKIARKFFPKSHIHAFGLTLRALPRVVQVLSSWDSLVPECGRYKWRRWLLDSFDSLNYTFSRTPGRGQANTNDERIQFFWAYINRIKEILGDIRLEGSE